jgi:hypothetical protein
MWTSQRKRNHRIKRTIASWMGTLKHYLLVGRYQLEYRSLDGYGRDPLIFNAYQWLWSKKKGDLTIKFKDDTAVGGIVNTILTQVDLNG